ncbi:MAG: glycosyltransferase [Sarcina sp.]
MIITRFLIDICNVIYYYNVGLTFFAWKKPKFPDTYKANKETSFTILIPCHNEDAVIEKNLLALYNTKYDKKLLHVVVIADNCTDKTISVTENFKNTHLDFNCTILDVNGGSKPKAINAAIKILKENRKWTSDNIFMLDSDNRVSDNIFKTFNYYHTLGENILQCKIQSQNDGTYVSKGFASSFNSMSYGFQLAKNRIGLSGSLSGTGFSVSRKVFDSVGFEKCDTLTEDLEFSILAILKNYKVKYVSEAYVLNQNLDELKPSIYQRARWCKGHMQVSIKLSKNILKAFFKKPSLQLFDSFLFVNSPSRTVIYTLGCFIDLIFYHSSNIFMFSLALFSLIYNFIFIFKCNAWKIKYIIPQFIYAACMYFIIFYSTFTYKNKTWVKTTHKNIE